MVKKTLNLNLAGRVKKVNTHSFFMALFEAISNSIHAIEDKDGKNGEIFIETIREPRQQCFAEHGLPITGFRIKDNGIGFNDLNMASFEEADTVHKASRGAKGVGRFTWLKFFEKIEISSVFMEAGKNFRREFGFSLSGLDIQDPISLTENVTSETCVVLSSINVAYEAKSYKSLDDIAISIIDHFIAFFITNSMPKITVIDGASTININDYYKNSIGTTMLTNCFEIGATKFTTVSIRNYLSKGKHSISLCGHKRVAARVNLDKRDNFFSSRFHDADLKEYAYISFVESTFLDEIVSDDRDGFKFIDSENDSTNMALFPTITREDILCKATEIAHDELADEIKKKKTENLNTVHRFIIESAPQYREVLKKHQDKISKIHDSEPIKIDAALRKIQFEDEAITKVEIAELIKKSESRNDELAIEAWNKKSQEIIERLSDNNKANLAGYIVNRNMILDLLKKQLEIGDDNKYVKEEIIHKLIFPMRKTSDEISYDKQNLWIIDERLSYHYYLASDKPLSSSPIELESRKEPDIIIFNTPIALNDRAEYERAESIVIIEFKRPGKSTAYGSKNPVEQIQEYIELIQSGKATTRTGRAIDVSSGTYFYGYVICELDSDLKKALLRQSMKETPDGRGMFGYFESHKAYIEVMSYQKMLDNALKRNRVLFEKLQLPII